LQNRNRTCSLSAEKWVNKTEQKHGPINRGTIEIGADLTIKPAMAGEAISKTPTKPPATKISL